EHCAEEGGEGRELNFLEEIDSNFSLMPLLCQEDLDETGEDEQFHRSRGRVDRGHGDGFVATALRLASRDEVAVEDTVGDSWEGKMLERATQVPGGVALLQFAG